MNELIQTFFLVQYRIDSSNLAFFWFGLIPKK